MRTSARLLALAACAWLLVAALAPCAACADVLPDPRPPHPKVVTTSPPTAKQVVHPPRTRATGRSSLTRDNLEIYSAEGLSVFLVPLLLTLLIEVPIIAIAGHGSAAAWKVGVLVNTATNPIAVLGFLALVPYVHESFLPLALLVEVAVVIAEWRIFHWALAWSNRRAITVALIANTLSFVVGFALLGGFTAF
jgi:hypothetical protein